MGVALALVERRLLHNSRPVAVSNARKVCSAAPPINTTPPRVVTAPPAVGVPIVIGVMVGTPNGPMSRGLPSGFDHSTLPLIRSTAATSPHGGAVHGVPSGERKFVRYAP
jgi:hypothetical protein